MINSKSKGKNGELEFCRLCRSEGYEVHRTAQFRGNTGQAGDVEGLANIHIEVKRNEHLNIHDAMNQAIRDSNAMNEGKESADCALPIVAHRKNDTKWLITMRAEDWFKIYRNSR